MLPRDHFSGCLRMSFNLSMICIPSEAAKHPCQNAVSETAYPFIQQEVENAIQLVSLRNSIDKCISIRYLWARDRLLQRLENILSQVFGILNSTAYPH